MEFVKEENIDDPLYEREMEIDERDYFSWERVFQDMERGIRRDYERALEEGRKEGLEEARKVREKKSLLGLLADCFLEEGSIDSEDRGARMARREGFSFSEEEAREAIKESVENGSAKDNDHEIELNGFICALRKANLLR